MTKSKDLLPVKDVHVNKDTTIADLMGAFSESGGFTASKLAEASDIFLKMSKAKGCTKFFSFPACICATGTRGIIRDMVKDKMVDVIITTCGTLDHDLARVARDYYQGTFMADDAALHRQGINRLGNVFVPNDSYGIVLEEIMQPILQDLWDEGQREWSTKEIIWEFGKRVGTEDSILYWAYKNKIPIYVPGITDGAFGCQLWMFYQGHRALRIDLMKDEQELSDIVFDAKKTGALMLGGGISKHHTIWWNQFRDGLDYAVQMTTADEADGSLSGARIREAVSWGKVKEKARHITVEGDVTILLPLLVASVRARL
ncbi:MAG: deoxyhypusine synthase [Candidatus Thermoplasmatota archaeon]|nr:deoxyhypusine synthase [Candidatus Thermoplasmatota archaeon]